MLPLTVFYQIRLSAARGFSSTKTAIYRSAPAKAGMVILLLCWMLLAASLLAGPRPVSSCNRAVNDAWALYIQAQQQLQHDLGDFLSSRRPDLKEIVLLNRDLQLTLVELRALKFAYLCREHPERIIKDQGVSRFSNFEWTDEDDSHLRSANPRYKEVAERAKALRQKNDSHPQWPALRGATQQLAKDADYLSIYERFEKRLEAVQRLLNK